MKNKVLKILVAVSIIFLSGYLINSNRQIYGNNRESIVKSIKSNSVIEDKNDFAIADIVDVDANTRIVGFFSSGGTGVAAFIKNKNNNYEMKRIYIHENTMTDYFHMINSDPDDMKFVVVSNGDGLDKIVVKTNGKHMESRDNLINKLSVSVFDYSLPANESQSSASIPIEARFLDVNGNPFNFK
jgi:hypothetical protein